MTTEEKKPKKSKKNDFSIIGYPNKMRQYNFSNALPTHQFRMLLLGPSALSGKTSTILSMLDPKRKQFKYHKLYGNSKRIYVFCPTIKLDGRWKDILKIPEENYFEDYDPDVMQAILDGQEETGNQPALIVMDDLICSLDSESKKMCCRNFISGRHWNCSFIVCSQYYKARGLPPTVRNNLSDICIWGCSPSQIKSVYEEHSSLIPEKTWMSLYKYCTDQKHGFMHINYREDPQDGRITCCFNKILQYS